jgi:hypothetical protein
VAFRLRLPVPPAQSFYGRGILVVVVDVEGGDYGVGKVVLLKVVAVEIGAFYVVEGAV